jgi:SAM-dependent methyltransferase
MVENADLRDVTSANLARGIRYQPTRARPFRRVLRVAGVPARGTFVDLGCGKGRACVLAAMHGFRRVVGIDYSSSLCAIAQANLDAFRARTGAQFESSLHAIDVVNYAFAADDSVVYLFNPFDDQVMGAVLERLRESLAQHPRPVWIVYHNPVWRGVIEESGAFAHAGDWSYGGCDFAVYRNRGA